MNDDARRLVFAEFADARALLSATLLARESGFTPADALSPHRLEEVEEALALPRSPARWPMLVAGVIGAILAYGVETWSAVIAYPFNSGGRPLNSWPVFLLVPFEFGVLLAAAAGLIGFFGLCGLPRLNHPLFDIEGIERATIDRFFLLVVPPPDPADESRLVALLEDARALRVAGTRQ